MDSEEFLEFKVALIILKPNSTATCTCTNRACGSNPHSRVTNLERFQTGGGLCYTFDVTGLTIQMNSACFYLGA